jgi:hypothetical protein
MRLRLAFAAVAISISAANAEPLDPERPLLACRQERLHFCRGVEPGGGRIIQCLWGHPQALSPDCREALVAMRNERENAPPAAAVSPPPTIDNSTPQPQGPEGAASATDEVGLTGSGGTYRVPVRINDSLTLNFTLDSGASDILIPADVVQTLIRNGTLVQSDFVGEKTMSWRTVRGSPV